MTKNNELGKEIEDKIQSLASDVYIQIEDRLTQLFHENIDRQNNAISLLKKEVKNKQAFDVSQDLTFIALREQYQTLEAEQLTHEQSHADLLKQADVSQITISQLEQQIQIQLAAQDEQTKAANLIQTDQVKNNSKQLKNIQIKNEQLLAEHAELSSTLTSKLQQATANNTALTRELSQSRQLEQLSEQKQQQSQTTTQEQLTIISSLEKNNRELTQTIEQTAQQFKETLAHERLTSEQAITEQKDTNEKTLTLLAESSQQLLDEQENSSALNKQVNSQDQVISTLNDDIAQLGEKEETSQLNINTLSLTLKTAEQKLIEVEQLTQDQQSKLAKEKQQLSSELEKSQQENNYLAKNLINEQADNAHFKKDTASLKSQVEVAKAGQDALLTRFNRNKEKQDDDNNKARETIKYLRDENTKITQENNEEINELKNKLIEFRLKFEYAQKQLTQSNN